jgi:membrane protease YdiL (CAAX protease family)
VTEDELERPSVRAILRLIYNTLVRLFHDPIGMLLASAFFLIMLWGPHGNLELVGLVWDGWRGPGHAADPGRGSIIPGIPWDQEWLSFAAGAVLLVVIPAILIKRVYKQDLRDYGLGLPPRDRWGLTLLSAALLLVLSLPAFYLGAHDVGMRATYPLYSSFASTGEFVVYQLGYFLFFVAIEFIFRGYLLFGLFRVQDRDAPPGVHGVRGPLVFGYYAILISMLSYTAWHLGKPIPELWGTLVWGIAAGTVALATRTIWHIILVHWLLNVFMDLVIWREWFLFPVSS